MNKQYRPRVSKENYDEVMRSALVGDSFDVAMRRYRKRMHGLEICLRNSHHKDDEIKSLAASNRELQLCVAKINDINGENAAMTSKHLSSLSGKVQNLNQQLAREKRHSSRLRNALIVASAIALLLAFM